MIITASRRTDIPALYSPWFLNRLKEGFVLVPNPYNPGRLGRVDLSPTSVDCIVFWTKNPIPMLDNLEAIQRLGYRFIIHFTLTPYDQAIESHLPPKEQLIQAFIELAKQTSNRQVIWRYDPVIVDNRFSASWHIDRFSKMCEALHPYTKRCILSFIDPYKHIAKLFRAMSPDEITAIASGFSRIAKNYGLALFTCAEEIDLAEYGIEHGACVDQKHMEHVIGSPLGIKADRNQRTACLCAEAVDIGVYGTCTHGCAYCYAVSNPKTAARRREKHDPSAPMLTGYPTGNEIITNRTAKSHKVNQFFLL